MKPRRASRRSLLAGLGAIAAGLSFGGLEGCAPATPIGRNGEAPRLNLYNWDTYTGKTTLADFRAATGIEVNMSLFATNDELFSKLRAGNPGFDVIVPSNAFVARMRLSDMLAPLDLAKIPNRINLSPAFQNPDYDPGHRYSMPYTWLVLGLGYRKSKVDGVPDSWKWVMESDRYKGRIGLFSEADDMIELGAKYLGHSARGIPPEMVDRIADMYIRQKPNVKLFHNDEGQDLLLSGDIDIVMEYNGDIAQVMQEDDDIDFVVPREEFDPQLRLPVHPQGRAAAGQRPPVHQLRARRKKRRGNRLDHPVPDPKRRGPGADAGELPRQSGDLSPAAGDGALRVRRVRRSGPGAAL